MAVIDHLSHAEPTITFTNSAQVDLTMAGVPTVIGNRYEVHVHTEARLVSDAAGVGVWRLELLVDRDGLLQVQDRFWRLEETGSLITTVDASVFVRATETEHTFGLQLTKQTPGASLQLTASEIARRTITVKDVHSDAGS
jgi:hypothetical protein